MGFITGISICEINTADAMARALQAMFLSAIADPSYLRICGDTDPGEEDRDVVVEPRDTSFIVVSGSSDAGWRITVTEDDSPAPVPLAEGQRRVLDLAKAIGPGRAIALLESLRDGRLAALDVVVTEPDGTRRVASTHFTDDMGRAARIRDGWGEDDPTAAEVQAVAPTVDEIRIITAARDLGISPSAAVVRLLAEPGSQAEVDAEKAVTMGEAQEQLDRFLKLEAAPAAAEGDDGRMAIAARASKGD